MLFFLFFNLLSISLYRICMEAFLEMSWESPLDVEPRKLKFHFEPNKQAFSTMKLSNYSENHVAFKVMSTNPKKYFIRPTTVGVLLPRSSCDVRVRMPRTEEVPSDMRCQDKFLIKSIVVSPGTTAEGARELFSERGHDTEACTLRVTYCSPLPNSGRSQVTTQQQGQKWFRFGNLLMTGIAIGMLGFIIWYLMLPLNWSFTFMIVALVMKVAYQLVSDLLEEWLVKAVAYLFKQIFGILFQRRQTIP